MNETRRSTTCTESELPTHWYNIAADLPKAPPPPLHPGTHQPIGPADLAPLFPMELIKQEVSTERYIEIPDEVREVYKLWRPTPLIRARRLEKALGHAGAHLLQVRRRVARRLAQAEHGRRAGLLQQAGGHHAPDDRDGRRPVGHRARDGLQLLRHRAEDLHGEGVVRAEAVPPLA